MNFAETLHNFAVVVLLALIFWELHDIRKALSQPSTTEIFVNGERVEADRATDPRG